MESCSKQTLTLKIADQSGFTMVELILVMTIVTILACTGRSLFYNVALNNQKVFDNELRTTLRYARTIAMATNSYVKVTLFSNSIRLSYASVCGSSATLTRIVDPLTNGNIAHYSRTAPGTVTLNYSLPSGASVGWPIYFNASGQVFASTVSGTCSPGNNMTINVVGQPAINIDAQTGFLQ